MSRSISPSHGKPYGPALVYRVWRAARPTVYLRRLSPRAEPPRRPGPVGPMPDYRPPRGDSRRPGRQLVPRRRSP